MKKDTTIADAIEIEMMVWDDGLFPKKIMEWILAQRGRRGQKEDGRTVSEMQWPWKTCKMKIAETEIPGS